MYLEFNKGRGESTSTPKPEKVAEEPFLVSSPEGKGKGGMPPPPSPPSSPSSSSSSSSYSKKKKKNSLIKLDVKFDLPIYDGELNVENIDNWIRQIDVYCRVQNVDSKRKKIQLASLQLGGTVLYGGKARPKLICKNMVKSFLPRMNLLLLSKRNYIL